MAACGPGHFENKVFIGTTATPIHTHCYIIYNCFGAARALSSWDGESKEPKIFTMWQEKEVCQPPAIC